MRCMGLLLNLIVRKVVKTQTNDIDLFSPYGDSENEENETDLDTTDTVEKENLKDFQTLIKKCRKIVNIFHSSNLAADALKRLGESNNEETHLIPVDVCTRWNRTQQSSPSNK
jgi:hypothetical protein